MAVVNITTTGYNVVQQPIRNLRVKINILNYALQTVDEISGNVIDCNVTIDANADIRRTCSLTIVIQDTTFDVAAGGRIWLDKYVQIYVGIDVLATGETEWFNQGIYLIDQPSYAYNATTNQLTLQGVDLMAKMTGLRNGYMEGIPTFIPAGSSVRDAMISAVTQLGGFTKYAIDECISNGVVLPVPYDITIDQGGTVYDILSALVNILPNYQIYFDVDGVFHYDLIPSGENEPIVVDDSLWGQVVIDESIAVDFQSVKNSIEVWGAVHEPKYYAVATLSGNIYSVNYGISSLTNEMLYGFVPSAIIDSPQLKVGSLSAYPIINEDGTPAVLTDTNVMYIVQWKSGISKFIFIGHQQAYGKAQDTNPDSPFYINGTTGIIRLPLYGGNYEVIQTDDLAQQRAEYELWRHTRLNDSISLTCVPIYWLVENIVVSYTQRNQAEPKLYIVKTVSTDYKESGTQTIEMIRYYPLYPTI